MTLSGLPAISGTTMRFERQLNHPIERVWHVLTDETETSYWFPARIIGPREKGAQVQFSFDEVAPGLMDDEMTAKVAEKLAEFSAAPNPDFYRGTILAFEPPRLFALDWAGETLRFELSPHAGGTKLVFLYTWPEGPAPQGVGPGWHVSLQRLAKRLAGVATPLTAAEFADVEAAYARAFG